MKKALKFFEDYPTKDDSVSDKRVRKRLGEEKWELLSQAGTWEDVTYLETLRTEIRAISRSSSPSLQLKRPSKPKSETQPI